VTEPVRRSSFVVALLAAGCSPLAKVVRADFEGFDVKAPAQSDAQLGRRLVGKQPETNACYKGTEAPVAKSWTARTLVYKGGFTGNLKADFGTTLKGEASASGERVTQVTLNNVILSKLSAVNFDPVGTCATDDARRAEYESADGREDLVITQAAKVEKVSIDDTETGQGKVQVDTSVVNGLALGADGGGNSSTANSWDGVNLYIAHYVERFHTTLRKAGPCSLSVGNGQTCDLEACSVKLDALGTDNGWAGSLSCQDGTSSALSGKLGDWRGVALPNGVSYSLRATGSGQVGLVKLDFMRWNVMSK